MLTCTRCGKQIPQSQAQYFLGVKCAACMDAMEERVAQRLEQEGWPGYSYWTTGPGKGTLHRPKPKP